MDESIIYIDDVVDFDVECEEQGAQPRPKKGRKKYNWIWKKKCSSFAEAEKFVKNSGLYMRDQKYRTKCESAEIIVYYCGESYQKGECPAFLRIDYDLPMGSSAYYVHERDGPHKNHMDDVIIGLSTVSKQLIEQKFKERFRRSKRILKAIRDAGHGEPTEQQVRYYVQKLRRREKFLLTISNLENGQEERGGKLYKWRPEKEYRTVAEAEQFILGSGLWKKIGPKRKKPAGERVYFYCKKGKSCDAHFKMEYYSPDGPAWVRESIEHHNDHVDKIDRPSKSRKRSCPSTSRERSCPSTISNPSEIGQQVHDDEKGQDEEYEDEECAEPSTKSSKDDQWVWSTRYSTAAEAEEALLASGSWKINTHKSKRTEPIGEELYYYCPEGSSRKKCPVGRLIVYDDPDGCTYLHGNNAKHANHKEPVLSPELTQFIKKIHEEDRCKIPTDYFELIEEAKLNIPDRRKVKNYIQKLRSRRKSSSNP